VGGHENSVTFVQICRSLSASYLPQSEASEERQRRPCPKPGGVSFRTHDRSAVGRPSTGRH